MPQPDNIQQESVANEHVKKIIEAKRDTFSPFRRNRIVEWRINMAYLVGEQYIGLAGGTLVVNKEVPAYAVTANKIMPAVTNDIAVGTKVPAVFDVVPAGTDSDDIATAVVGQKMLNYLRRINDFDAQREQLILWFDIATIGWRKNWWDPRYKVAGTNPEQEEDGHNPNMQPGELIYEGEARSMHVPTNEMIWDWRLNPKKLPWIIHARKMSIGEARARYGEKADIISDTETMDSTTNQNEFEMTILNTVSNRFGLGSVSSPRPQAEDSRDDREVNYYELWQVRDGTNPMGIYAEMAGGVVMVNKPYPIESYPHGEVPFVSYAPLMWDKTVMGAGSRISQARPLQREVNRLRTLILDNTETLGSGLWMIHRDSKVNFDRVDSGVGVKVEWEGRVKPQREAGVSVAGGIFAHLIKVEDDIDGIFAFHPVSKGKQPKGGPRSGVGLEVLHEGDITQLSPMILAMENSDEKSLQQLLVVGFANYKERTMSIVGKDNEWAILSFNPEEMKGKFNVQVRAGSSMPVSRAIERQFTTGLIQLGLINIMDPVQKRRAMQSLDIGGMDSLLKEDAKDVNYARKEFLVAEKFYLESGGIQPDMTKEQIEGIIVMPPVNLFDNHEIHVIEHRLHLVDKYYDYISSQDPGLLLLAAAMQEHWAMHSQILADQQIRQAMMAQRIENPPKEESSSKESQGD